MTMPNYKIRALEHNYNNKGLEKDDLNKLKGMEEEENNNLIIDINGKVSRVR